MLLAYDKQVRQSTSQDGTGARTERAGQVVRRVPAGTEGGAGVFWSGLDEATADGVIATQVAFFRARGQQFEWKLYGHDQPADLADRLRAAGLEPEQPEMMMAAEPSAVPPAEPPAGVRIEQATGHAGVHLVASVHERVFGPDPGLAARLLAQLSTMPELMAMTVAMAGDEPVSAARIEFVAGAQFAGLWGGGTLPAWRGQGIYRAMLAYRAALAARHGCRYLQVDAMPASEPILERCGFSRLTTTTPYLWTPG